MESFYFAINLIFNYLLCSNFLKVLFNYMKYLIVYQNINIIIYIEQIKYAQQTINQPSKAVKD
jgi:hypothetical protein